jgi:hypothetical protein
MVKYNLSFTSRVLCADKIEHLVPDRCLVPARDTISDKDVRWAYIDILSLCYV